jgi:hypothetical protein
MRLILYVMACLVLPAQAQQIYRCQGPGGQTVFQQAACSNGAPIEVKPTNSVAADKPAAGAASAPNVAATSASAGPATLSGTATTKTDVEAAADRCLDWYRPRLRDPRGAYHRDAVLDKGVLRLTIYATNRFGGYVSKAAACEVKRGEVDASWTRIHAERLSW